MAQASAHDKQMENLMRTEIFMLCIENRQFQCVDNAARRVDKPAGQQPRKALFGSASTICRKASTQIQPIAM